MTPGKEEFGRIAVEPEPGMPDAQYVVAPADADEAAKVLDMASERGLKVVPWGAGSHQGYGHPLEPDLVLSTRRMDRVVSWSPEDLTITVEAGVVCSDLADQLGERSQTAVLPESGGTVGGAVAAGLSGWGRLRYGPVRDRVLEVVFATGDGRVVRGGAPLVKNVTGYDIPRLVTGSFGALGLVTQVALKLWPLGTSRATVEVANADQAAAVAYRPLAVIAERERARVYLAGTPAEVAAQAAALGGQVQEGLAWPAPLEHEAVLVLRVPPGLTSAAVGRIPPDWEYQASWGVGEVRIGGSGAVVSTLASLREWAAGVAGAVVIERAAPEVYREIDPWGDAGSSLALQRRVKAAFDPLGVCNPGRLPGGL